MDGLYAALNDAGVSVTTLTEHVRAATPTPDDITSLNLTPGAAVLVTRRIIRDNNGLPLAMEETRRNAEDVQLTVFDSTSVASRPTSRNWQTQERMSEVPLRGALYGLVPDSNLGR